MMTMFKTYSRPNLSNAMYSGEFRPVWMPAMVLTGAALPLAPGAYTVTVLLA